MPMHRLGSEELALMKPTAFLINDARGSLRDERISGAGMDVLVDAVPPPDHCLLKLEEQATADVARVLETGCPTT